MRVFNAPCLEQLQWSKSSFREPSFPTEWSKMSLDRAPLPWVTIYVVCGFGEASL